MKIKMTKNQILKFYPNVVAIGYCQLDYLLQYIEPFGYASGVYGWNYDVFVTDYNVTICTGYRGMPGYTVNYDVTRDFNLAAEKIAHDYSIPYDDRKNAINKLLQEFCDYCKENIF